MKKFNPNKSNNKAFILENKNLIRPIKFSKRELCRWFEENLLGEKVSQADLTKNHQRHIKMLEENIIWNYGELGEPDFIGYYIFNNEHTKHYFEEEENESLNYYFVLIETNSRWWLTVPMCNLLNKEIDLKLGLNEEDYLNETARFFSYAECYFELTNLK